MGSTSSALMSSCLVDRVAEVVSNRSSASFSPGRRPVKTMSMSPRPDMSMRVRATSTIFICSPMSSTMTSPSEPMTEACMTSWQASGMSMK